MSVLFRWVVSPLRSAFLPSYSLRTPASLVLREYIRKRAHPPWTSFFVAYRHIQDDQFGAKHFNFQVDDANYHILRIGCYPYIKYHCTQRQKEDLSSEDRVWRAITTVNLGMSVMLSSSPLQYQPTAYFFFILLFIVFPLVGLSLKVVCTLVNVVFRLLYSIYRFICVDPDDSM